MITNELSCKELVELVTAYVEDALPPPERARFEAHLQVCAGCQNYLQQMRQTIALVGRLDEEALQPEARRALLQVFRNWKQDEAVGQQ